MDENVLIELKNLWQQKLEASKAVENTTTHNDTNVLGNFIFKGVVAQCAFNKFDCKHKAHEYYLNKVIFYYNQ